MALTGEKIIKDLDHARLVVKETCDTNWNDVIKHSEPQVIVACATMMDEMGTRLDALVDENSALRQRVAALEEAIS